VLSFLGALVMLEGLLYGRNLKRGLLKGNFRLYWRGDVMETSIQKIAKDPTKNIEKFN